MHQGCGLEIPDHFSVTRLKLGGIYLSGVCDAGIYCSLSVKLNTHEKMQCVLDYCMCTHKGHGHDLLCLFVYSQFVLQMPLLMCYIGW